MTKKSTTRNIEKIKNGWQWLAHMFKEYSAWMFAIIIISILAVVFILKFSFEGEKVKIKESPIKYEKTLSK